MGSMVFLRVMEASPPETKTKKKISMVYDTRSENAASIFRENAQKMLKILPGYDTLIDQIFAAIDEFIEGRLVCGAGGGGFLQVVLKKGVTRDQVHARLKEVFQDSDVDVYNATLI